MPGQPLNKTSNSGASGKILLMRTALKNLFVNTRRAPGWITSCNTGIKVTPTKQASLTHAIITF